MPKGARTVTDLEKALATMRARDTEHARELRTIRAELSTIARLLDLSDSPAANSTRSAATPCGGTSAGTALAIRARSFFRRFFTR